MQCVTLKLLWHKRQLTRSMLTAIFEASSPLDSQSSNFQSANNKTELRPQHSGVLIQAELDTPTSNILIEEAQEQPPFCSRRRGLAHDSVGSFFSALFAMASTFQLSCYPLRCVKRINEVLMRFEEDRVTFFFLVELIMIMRRWQARIKGEWLCYAPMLTLKSKQNDLDSKIPFIN